MTMSAACINCILCKMPAVRFCNSCLVELCVDCVSKHVDKLDSMSHDIAPFKKKRGQLVFSECETHAGRKCEAYCQKCQTPVCTKCLIGPHKNHDAEDIVSFADLKKQEIKRQMMELEEKIQFYQTTSSDIQRKISKATAEYSKVEQELAKLRKIWHQEVDAIFDEFNSLINSKRDHDLGILTANEKYIQKLIPDLMQILQSDKNISQSKKASEIANYTNKNEFQCSETNRHLNFDATIPSLITNTQQGKELSVDFGKLEATLTHTSFDNASDECPP